MRLALGAGRGRLLQQLLTESVLLSLIGGVAGVALAWASSEPSPRPRRRAGALPLPLDFAMDRRVLAVRAAALRPDRDRLRRRAGARAPRGRSWGRRCGRAAVGRRARTAGSTSKKVFVVAEVALSLLLLIAAGLFVRSLAVARAIDPGIDVDRLVSAPLEINLLRYTSSQGRAFYQQVVERAERLPGVESASVARVAMLAGGGRILSVHVQGRASTHDRVISEGSGMSTTDPTQSTPTWSGRASSRPSGSA